MLNRNGKHHAIIGEVIREKRKEAELTLATMAKSSNVSLGYLSQIERGKNCASVDALLAICKGLGMKLSELFGLVEEEETKGKPLQILRFPKEDSVAKAGK